MGYDNLQLDRHGAVGVVTVKRPKVLNALDVTTLTELHAAFGELGDVLARESRKVTLRVDKEQAASITSRLLAELPVLDLTIEDPPIEDVIQRVFSGDSTSTINDATTRPPQAEDTSPPGGEA